MNCYLFVITFLFFILLSITNLTYGQENGYYYYDDDDDNNYNNVQQNSITENKHFNIAVAGD